MCLSFLLLLDITIMVSMYKPEQADLEVQSGRQHWPAGIATSPGLELPSAETSTW